MSVIKNTELFHEALAYFNQPVLNWTEVTRLIGYGEDESDCYYIFKGMNGNIRWSSCVGGFIALDRLIGQGHVETEDGDIWDDFVRLDNVLKLNGSPREKEFRLELEYIEP